MAVWSASRAVQFKGILKCTREVVTVLNVTTRWKICGRVEVCPTDALPGQLHDSAALILVKEFHFVLKTLSCPSELTESL
jgi:hypothetical protein